MSTPPPPRPITAPLLPRAAYRLGLAGPAGAPSAAQREHLRALVNQAAAALLAPLPRRAGLPEAEPASPPLLRLVLAEGCGAAAEFADLARQALGPAINDQHLALRVETVLSHPAAPLCHGMPVTREEPPQLLPLDGQGADPARLRRAVDRMVLRNCDLLVVLCPDPAAMTGEGAAESLPSDTRFGVDVLWLPWDEAQPPALLRDAADLANLQRPPPPAEPAMNEAPQNPVPRGEDALREIARAIVAANAPPLPPHPHPHGLLERATLFLRGLSGPPPDAYAEFLRERDHQGRGLWAFYPWARNLAARQGSDPGPWVPPLVTLALLGAWAAAAAWLHQVNGAAWLSPAMLWVHLAGLLALLGAALLPGVLRKPPPATPPPTEAEYWRRAYAAPDRLSTAYAARYRSTTLLVIMLISLALIFAVIVLILPKGSGAKLAVGVAEAVTLAIIALAVGATLWGRWQPRWVGYRLLAELCRKQEALARFAWSLPVFDVARATRAGLADGAWVAWHFNALMRAAPLSREAPHASERPSLTAAPQPDFSTEGKAALRRATIGERWFLDAATGERRRQEDERLQGLIAGQIAYHKGRQGKGERAALCWALWGETAFLLTVLAVAAKLIGKWVGMSAGWETGLGLAAAALPAVSAGFFALRAYSEERLLADQSAAMVQELQDAQRLLEAVEVAAPLASQDLAGLTAEIAERMLADVTGWAQLVRVKVVEAG